MIINMVKIFFIILLLFTNISAKESNGDISSNIEIYKSSKIVDIKDIDNKLFESYKKPINIGLTNKEVWIKLNFSNSQNRDIDKLIVFETTHIGSIKIYEKAESGYKLDSNLSKIRELERTLFPYFALKLKAKESKNYYVNIKASQIPSSFKIAIEDKKTFFANDRFTQFVDIMIIGFLLTVVIYFLFQYFNSKELSYIYFSMFVLMGLFYLFSYTGLAQIYASKEFLILDKSLFVIKLNIIILLSSFFAIEFLKLSKKGYIYKLYIFIIALCAIEIISASFFNYSYYFVLLVSALYAVINVVAGLRAYINGCLKEAKFFLIASVILAIGVYANIFNALGVNIIHIDSSSFMMIFALAILFFVLGYAYRYYINKKEEFELFATEFDKKMIIEQKVKQKQEELKNLESSEKVLKQNMSNIIKNNLQTTVSMLKLQEPKVKEQVVLEQLKSLQGRLLSIVKSYSLFLSAKNPNFIVMRDYLQKLIDDTLLIYKSKDINIKLDVDAVLDLEDAIYVGLSVVDYIINRVEDEQNQEEVVISLKSNGDDYQFKIKDDKIDSKIQSKSSKSWIKRFLKSNN